jgi:predicted transcriptional regulator
MSEPSALQQLLGYQEICHGCGAVRQTHRMRTNGKPGYPPSRCTVQVKELAAYTKSHLLRTLVQMAIIRDRGIPMTRIAEHIGVSRQRVHQYFDLRGTLTSASDEFAERVEEAIEAISKEIGFELPINSGSKDEDYLQHEVITRDLMAAPPHRGARHGVSI